MGWNKLKMTLCMNLPFSCQGVGVRIRIYQTDMRLQRSHRWYLVPYSKHSIGLASSRDNVRITLPSALKPLPTMICLHFWPTLVPHASRQTLRSTLGLAMNTSALQPSPASLSPWPALAALPTPASISLARGSCPHYPTRFAFLSNAKPLKPRCRLRRWGSLKAPLPEHLRAGAIMGL